MKCPKANETPCETEEVHYGMVAYRTNKGDRELCERFGVGTRIVYRLLCHAHNLVFSAEEYHEDGWKTCKCPECLTRLADFESDKAAQQVKFYEGKTIEEAMGVPF